MRSERRINRRAASAHALERRADPSRARSVMSPPRRATWRSFAHAACDVDATLERDFGLVERVDVAVPGGTRGAVDALDAGVMGRRFVRCEASMSIADALEHNFVHAHARRAGRDGEGTAFGMKTANARVDFDDCWCVTPRGRFVGSLMRDTSVALGLQSVEDARGKALVSVNLRREEFRVSNRFHDRLGECARTLEKKTGKTKVYAAFLVNGEPQTIAFPPSVTDAKLVENEKTSERMLVNLECEEAKLLKSLEPPTRGESKSFEVEDLERVLEFCGRLNLGNEYILGTTDERGDVVEVRRVTGFLLYPEMRPIIDVARKIVNEGHAPWAVITIWAFAHMPSNLTGEHVKKPARDPCMPKSPQVLVLVIFPGDAYLKFAI